MLCSSGVRRFLVVVAFTVILIANFTLASSAQGPDNGVPSDRPAGAAQETVLEEEVKLPGEEAGSTATAGNADPDVVEEEVVNGSEAPGQTFYKRWAAETFVPYHYLNEWANMGSGCFRRLNGYIWTTDVQLPEGAIIDYFRVYYYDTDSAYNVEATLLRYDSTGSSELLASASGSGTPGWSSAGSGLFSHSVDNLNWSYAVNMSFTGGTTAALRACAVRIRYQYDPATLQ
ncbi:MAG: hypothetical protein L0322_25365 [Chloroflexi bacterium]|nr:hypothetical protein [Chloroflexota bacterium]MCI0580761.1 hypothetical protein [Chloroflexota bacterium]MCI0644944.1 hypothetical protein [Chloroflexota bacterium]